MNQLDNIKRSLECPITAEKMNDAVTLVPCSDKIQKKAAEQLFGPVSNGWKVGGTERCPLCTRIVEGYFKDRFVINIVENFKGLSKEAIEKSVAQVKEDLYPGKKGAFKCVVGSWLRQYNPYTLRYLAWNNEVKDALIDRFDFNRTADPTGMVTIGIFYSYNNTPKVIDFLKKFDIEVLGLCQYRSKTLDEARVLVKILLDNNIIPSNDARKLKSLVKSGDIKEVLTHEELEAFKNTT